jgi:Xaa-Pro aminopeptidase
MAAVRPGVSSDVPDNAARAVIQQAGFEDAIAHSLGHGVGLAVHEAPKLSRLSPSPLTEGMVVTVEPGIYLPGKGGVRLEETVLIESEGVRVLTREPHRYAF